MTDPNKQLVDRDDLYVESQIIMTTVRVVAPFILTYGLFTTFHGANTPGGAFQGGVIVGATVLMIAFAFGIAPTRDWIRNSVVVSLFGVSLLTFGILGAGGLIFGGSFFDHAIFTVIGFEHGVKWSMELFEIGGIFLIIVGTIIGLFFVMASGDRLHQMRGETQ